MDDKIMIVDNLQEYCNVEKDFEDSISLYPMNNDEIYHYTSPEGLKGIIENNALWFTNADYLNDKSEGFYFISLFKEIVQEYKQTNGISEMTEYLDSIDNFIGYGVVFEKDGTSGGRGDAYICCFSKDSDSLPMWNYYIKNNKSQGYNIRFFCCNLCDIQGFSKKIIEVVYDEKTQREKIINLINKLNKYYKKKSVKEIDYAKYLFYSEMCKLKYVFKNPCFEYEHEIRIMIILPDEKKDKVKYRVGPNGEFIPYIEVSLNFNDDIFDTGINFSLLDTPQFTIAPLMNYDEAKHSLEMFLDKHNVKNYNVVKSKCPIRY